MSHEMSKSKRWIPAVIFICILFFVPSGATCVAPDAFKTKLGLTDTTITVGEAERIETNTKLLEKNIRAETINYDGASWVVLTAVAFLIIIGIFIAWLFKQLLNYKGMLSLVTTAVHQSDPHIKQAIKIGVNKHALACKDGNKHKKCLSKECVKNGVFADQ